MSDIDITGSISNEPTITGQFEPDIVIQGNVDSQFPAQVSVDSVTTGDPGTDAAVVNVGTPGNARLRFTIPRGDAGEQGDTGPQGIQGETGPAGADSTVPGPAGADGVVQSLVAGSNITIDATDPANPIINSTASGSGDVVGPASAVDGTPAVFDGTTGKLIKNITYAAFKTLLSLVKGDVGLGNVDNTSDATKNSATATLTNKTLTSPVINSATGSAASSFTATTQTSRDNSTKLATTAYVDGATREKLTANRTYYVRTDGSDSNNGLANTSGGAFLTLQKAVDAYTANLDFAGFTVTIQIADGTYTGGVIFSGPWTGGGAVTIQGNNTTPANVLISTSGNCFANNGVIPGVITLKDFKLTCSAGLCIINSGPGTINFQNLNFGAASSSGAHLDANTKGAKIQATGNYTISAGAGWHIIALRGEIIVGGIAITLTGTPTFAQAYAFATRQGYIEALSATWSGTQGTGNKAVSELNSVIFVGGGGLAFFPGSVNATTATGGQYS
jgi:hypothetical protein